MTLGARITGVGRHVPAKVLTNHDLEQMVSTSDEWIVERTGIRERRIAGPDEFSSTLGAEAAKRALASAGIDGSTIDLVVVATSTPDGMFPAVASRIQAAIGATHAGAFDVNAACNGFIAAFAVAQQFIAAGGAERVLVVGAETMSRIVDWTDRGTCILFGDGAGAVVLERAADGEPGSVGDVLLRSDGDEAGLLYATGPCTTTAEAIAREAHIVMDGGGVFRRAVLDMLELSKQAIAQAGLTTDDIALVVPHQANVRILKAMAERMAIPMDRVFVNLDRYGNTSSATIPIALAEAEAEGRLKPGDHVLLTAFGGGLSWGATVIEWAGVRVPGVGAPSEARAATV